jgi:hypothetical protein
MARSKSGKAADLSGPWSGVYSYPLGAAPVSFSARLTQNGIWITGVTEEIGTSGESTAKRLTATLQGRREGARVIWLKLYDRAGRDYDAVSYEGAVNLDASEISGRWTIPNGGSGAFLMIRGLSTRLSATRGAAQKI